VIERKYLDMFERLSREPAPALEPLPGFFARRRRDLPPSRGIVDAAPTGAARA
jgi:hypothetical protein